MYLQLKKLTKIFNNVKVVNNLSLSIKKGELLCLLGPSGCGKTTTLKMIGGLIKSTAGQIIIDGEDITCLPPELRPVSTVFQSYALFPHMNVLDNVIYGLKFQGYKKKEAIAKGEEYLNIVELFEYRKSKIHELSGGQQQRVALARSLITNPKVLLLDEPLSNLDAKLRVKMRNDIKKIQDKFKTTMIFVTHDQEEALSIGDEIAIMNDGLLEQIGSPEDVYNNPSSSFVLNFLGNANIIYLDSHKRNYVRPENVLINRNHGDYKGKVIQKNYMGFYTIYLVETDIGIISVNVQNGSNEKYSVEDRVYLSFVSIKDI
ncbi:ABC transporter ATP-binding protein [Clostridium sp. OS1-26]|uniref:ABC transporter ATP-binding protein n=1 Tax=Clostridium sp. OS1-26 TaxID=3070681 RepID=UPI0027E14CDA|nr:ABC transporter ATP-binding protein [Clostridium sp. OS1-26]WML37458.1 ABC transporter ATP-binding protein [Clostridium sp. OS1-26]